MVTAKPKIYGSNGYLKKLEKYVHEAVMGQEGELLFTDLGCMITCPGCRASNCPKGTVSETNKTAFGMYTLI